MELFFFSSRRRHTRCALVTGVQTCALPIYEADDRELRTPKPKTPEQALAAATEYFEEWMPLATSSQKIYLFCLSQREHRDAAFNLHQATERLYACLLLTLTFYTPYNHNIAFLRSLAERSEEHTSELQSLMRISYAV